MKTKNATDSLDEMILAMKQKKANDLALLREQLHMSCEGLKPLNLIKNVFEEITTSPEIKSNLVDNALSLGSGLLTKKILVGGSHNSFRKILGTIAEFATANLVSKHTDEIKNVGKLFFKHFIGKNGDLKKEASNGGINFF
ncbi:MAG: hypothetical protein ABI426_02560 [Flavobacterium sp.]